MILFEERIKKHSAPEPNSGCWLWTKCTDTNGYGQTTVNRRTRQAHRLSYEVFRGPIPKGKWVLHSCDTRCCVNPDHLRLGTPQDNSDDMVRRGRSGRGERGGNAKYTEAQVMAWRDRYSKNERMKDIAASEGVPYPTLYEAVRGKKWTHLPVPPKQRWYHRPVAQPVALGANDDE